ncbi:TlpA family protein disulfide reductase [Haloferax sp. MBLA0076]|uniref:TlpA family protein disulfide reductase n=1 Tax=Haloferax litoreum TaxID=2666140 RepID=A0A6A8GG84_9EURY|nr:MULTISPECIES: TlpA family protein disulfide reductase [Haloferax]KAB1192992.1 TlpA family protein disulfide reductase [Haloferax sp. CBA1148]MRX21482.1 TlpA family protein disulfide reductase [Haloferax litoreum]
MTNRQTRRGFLRLAGAGSVGLAGCLGGGQMGGGGTGGEMGSGGAGTEGTDESGGDRLWYTTELTDVRSGEVFTIEELVDRPVFVETFAVWCSNCLRQQKEMINFHDAVGDDVVTVALDIDPNEDAEKVREHAERHGFDWRYALSPESVTKSLTDEFGSSMASAPTVPMLRVCPDGTATRIKDGFKSTDYLRERVAEC